MYQPTPRKEKLKNKVATGQNRISCQMENGKWKMENDGRGGGIPIISQSHNLSASPRLRVEKSSPAPSIVNHWIPFAESEVDAKDAYKSHFMVEFLEKCRSADVPSATGAPAGGTPALRQDELFTGETPDLFAADAPNPSTLQPFNFSTAASRVLDAGRRLWRYYHAQPNALPDASFYDIRGHFQGFKPNGHMNPDSPDAEYTRLIADLRAAMKSLAAQIAPKVREHGFLR